MIHIGIDPGTHTGLAVWDSGQERFLLLETLPIHKALDLVCKWQQDCKDMDVAMDVTFEDARQRTWFGKGNVSAKMQGAGSVKRDCSIWEDFLRDKGIPFWAKPPGKGMTKVTPDYFRMISGYQGRTSEHSRDAAMLVIGR